MQVLKYEASTSRVLFEKEYTYSGKVGSRFHGLIEIPNSEVILASMTF